MDTKCLGQKACRILWKTVSVEGAHAPPSSSQFYHLTAEAFQEVTVQRLQELVTEFSQHSASGADRWHRVYGLALLPILAQCQNPGPRYHFVTVLGKRRALC